MRIQASCLSTSLALALIVAPDSGAAGTPVGPDEIVAAFVPQLTGDPARDFARDAGLGETFTVYVISGPIASNVASVRFSLEISEAAILGFSTARAPGDATVAQNSIGTFVYADVALPACAPITAETVIAELDLALTRGPTDLTLRLVGWSSAADPPERVACDGTTTALDHSGASPLSLSSSEPVSVGGTIAERSWGAVKTAFDRGSDPAAP